MNISDKKVLLIGGNGILGTEYTKFLNDKVKSLSIIDLNNKNIKKFLSAKTVFYKSDVTKIINFKKNISLAIKNMGGIDVLINNAALTSEFSRNKKGVFDEFKKLNRFEYQSDITENTKFYLNDILLIDRHLLMKNYDDLLELGFKYNGKPKFDKTEIDLNSFYTISNGELKLIILPYGRTGFPNTKSTPYVIIQKN